MKLLKQNTKNKKKELFYVPTMMISAIICFMFEYIKTVLPFLRKLAVQTGQLNN